MENKEKKIVKKDKKEVTKPVTKEKTLKTIKYSIEGKFIHISVGDNSEPADQKDINEIEENIKKIIPDEVDCLVFVTHHAVKVSVL